MRNIERAGMGLRSRSDRWMADNALALRSTDVPMVEGLADRVADNWEPMLAIARLIGEDVYQEALTAAGTYIDDTESVGELLLAHIQAAFVAKGMPEALSTETILRYLVDRDDGPWARWWADKVANDNTQVGGGQPGEAAEALQGEAHQDPRGRSERSWLPPGGPRTRVGLVCSPYTAGKTEQRNTAGRSG